MEHIHFLKQNSLELDQGPDCRFVANMCFFLLAFSKIATHNILVESNISSLSSKECEIHAFKENQTHFSSFVNTVWSISWDFPLCLLD